MIQFMLAFFWKNASTARRSAGETIKLHTQLVKKRNNLADDNHHQWDFKPRFLQPPSPSSNDLDAVASTAWGDSLAAEEPI